MIQLKNGFETEHPISSHALTTHHLSVPILIMLGLLTVGHCHAQIQSPNPPSQTRPLSTEITANATIPADIVIVLDNSGSMKTNDPKALMKDVVSSFVAQLTQNTRLSIVLFDQKAKLALGLMEVDAPDFRIRLNESLQSVNYQGQRTDIPAGLERALYELEKHGRPEAQLLVILLTDGIIDTGDSGKDLERARWLREDLLPKAKRLGIRIFGIALTEAADFQLIQSMANATDGDYFRVLTAPEVASTFYEINGRIQAVATRPITNNISSEIPTKAQGKSAQTEPPRTLDQAYLDWRWALLGIGLIVFFTAWILYRNRTCSKNQDIEPESSTINPIPKAVLIDLSGQANVHRYAIHKPLVRIGRDPNDNDIVIAHDTVSSQHATIKYREGHFYLCDLRSSNGTSINGKPFSDPEKAQEILLKTKDRIQFDIHEFEFVLDEQLSVKATRIAGARGGTRLRGAAPNAREDQVETEMLITHIKEDPMPVTQVKEVEVPKTQMKENGLHLGAKIKSGMCPNHEAWAASELCSICVTAYCKQCVREKDGQWVCVNCDGDVS